MVSTATIYAGPRNAFMRRSNSCLTLACGARRLRSAAALFSRPPTEARAFGVRSGMPGRRARQLCRDLVFVGGHFDEYQLAGDAAIRVDDLTPSIERISIDQVFADVAGCTAHPRFAGRDRTDGSGSRPRRAWLADVNPAWRVPSTWPRSHRSWRSRMDWSSSIQKLNASSFTACPSRSCGVGAATSAAAKIGVTTIGQLAESSPQSVERLLGHAVGRKLTALAWQQRSAANPDAPARSAGAQSALGDDGPRSNASSNRRSIISPDRTRRQAPCQIPGWPDCHNTRALRRFALGHALVHAVGTDFCNEGSR